MPAVRIDQFTLAWSMAKRVGRISLKLANGTPPRNLDFSDGGEFAAVAAILAEEPVFFDPANGTIYTGPENPGL